MRVENMNFIKLVFLFWTCYFLLITNSYAVDMEILQEQCADIGFKIGTPANGKCVLQLMQIVKNKEAQKITI